MYVSESLQQTDGFLELVLTVLELPASTQLGKFGRASFCEPSPLFTMFQVLKSPDSATWM